jgi:hypothetical protein
VRRSRPWAASVALLLALDRCPVECPYCVVLGAMPYRSTCGNGGCRVIDAYAAGRGVARNGPHAERDSEGVGASWCVLVRIFSVHVVSSTMLSITEPKV